VKSTAEVLDYLRNRMRSPQCSVSGPLSGHFGVTCGTCSVTIPDDDVLTTTTANEIERKLEPCLGPHWMP
jgi:hypothetical protein